jgi:hypothetical protein
VDPSGIVWITGIIIGIELIFCGVTFVATNETHLYCLTIGTPLMAIELVEDFADQLLTVKVSGKLSSDDYLILEPGVEKLIAQSGKIKILFIMHDFHGWDMGAVWEDIKFATKHCSDIERIAMVGESTWEKWMATICKPFTMSKVKYFDTNEQQQAIDWLTA